MNKSQLVEAIATQADLPKSQAGRALDSLIDVITNELKAGNDVALLGFGTFKVSERAARTGRNPQTGEAIQIAASKAPTFKAGKGLKEALNAK
jgi:DNA-binding protein HU-beta